MEYILRQLMNLMVTLEPITEDNFEAVMDIELPPEQASFVASNAYSIAQACFYPDWRPLAIYCNGTPAGLLLYDVMSHDEPGHRGIYRLVVDPAHQGRGVGRRAMELLLQELRALPGTTRITICYKPSNALARRFYASLGFTESGIDESGEMVAEIRPDETGPAHEDFTAGQVTA
jgi:diamine N-acetyltransferase